MRSARVVRKVAVWVRIPELPLELYNGKFLKRLGAQLGTLLKIDILTSIHSRGQFARISVEIDLEKPVVPQVLVRGEVLNLEYEALHTICFHCGVYGHREAECRLKEVNTGAPATGEEGKASPESQEEMMTEVTPIAKVSEKECPIQHVTEKGGASMQREDVEQISGQIVVGDDTPKVIYGPWIVVHKANKGKRKADHTHKSGKDIRMGNHREASTKKPVGTGSSILQGALGKVDVIEVKQQTG